MVNFRFDGGVARGSAAIDFRPSIGSVNGIPVDGGGSVKVIPYSPPSGQDVSCYFKMKMSEGSRYRVHDLDSPNAWCENTLGFWVNPSGRVHEADGRPVIQHTQYAARIAKERGFPC